MNYLKLLKLTGIFLIIEIMIVFITSLLNLIGVNQGITSIILLILNIIIFFIMTFNYGKISSNKGFLSGLLMGLIYIILMFLINGLLFKFYLKISTIIYYLILLIVSMIGGSIGINKKVEKD